MVILMNTLLSLIPSFKYTVRVFIRIFCKATWIFLKEIYKTNVYSSKTYCDINGKGRNRQSLCMSINHSLLVSSPWAKCLRYH